MLIIAKMLIKCFGYLLGGWYGKVMELPIDPLTCEIQDQAFSFQESMSIGYFLVHFFF